MTDGLATPTRVAPAARRVRVFALGLAFALALFSPVGSLSAGGPVPVVELSDLDGDDGFVVRGAARSDNSGASVAGAGDLNGDGIDDLVIGAPNDIWSPDSVGEAYVVFGSAGTHPASVDLAALDGTDGFVMRGIEIGDKAGSHVASAGDLNGDGVDDLVVGAYYAIANGLERAGQGYVVFGSRDPFPPSLELSALDGVVGFAINGLEDFNYLGRSAAGLGDFNGDGIDDLAIGAYLARPNDLVSAGSIYVIFGTTDPFPAAFEVATLDGTNGLAAHAVESFDFTGYSVAGPGDVNGDGLADLLIGAYTADPNGVENAGRSYVVFGSTAASAEFELADLDGSNGFAVNGAYAGDYSALVVAGVGDLNGDSFADVLIGTFHAAPHGRLEAGTSHVVFGSGLAFPAELELSALDGTNGFTLNGIDPNDRSGRAPSGAGDVNGDGLDDLLLGALGGDPNGRSGAGESYVVFGSRLPFAAEFELSSIDGRNGFVVHGAVAADQSGGATGGAGDMNGDGLDDLVIGARYADPLESYNAGESYVVFGFPTGPRASVSGSCPGEMELVVEGATPGATLEVFHSRTPGVFELDSDPCAGLELDLASPKLGARLTADEFGQVTVATVTTAGWCRQYVQLVDSESCSVSSVLQLP